MSKFIRKKLKVNEVAIYYSAYLLEETVELNYKFSCLSLEEKAKATNFYLTNDRIRFIQSRYLVKSIIADYIGEQIREIKFQYNKYGKPELMNNDMGIFFNVSHSNKLIILSFAKHHNIGVDVEFIKEEDINDLINNDIFTGNEINFFKNLNNQQKKRVFYKMWSCKEAYLKAIGYGLYINLNTVEVGVTNYKKITSLGNNLINASQPYCLIDIPNLPETYVATLALPKMPLHITYFNRFW